MTRDYKKLGDVELTPEESARFDEAIERAEIDIQARRVQAQMRARAESPNINWPVTDRLFNAQKVVEHLEGLGAVHMSTEELAVDRLRLMGELARAKTAVKAWVNYAATMGHKLPEEGMDLLRVAVKASEDVLP